MPLVAGSYIEPFSDPLPVPASHPDQSLAHPTPSTPTPISRGLLHQMEDESELAGVLAREISNLAAARPLKAAGIPVSADATPTTAPASRPSIAATQSPPLTPAQTAAVNRLSTRLTDILIK